jgi:hypothetical protein
MSEPVYVSTKIQHEFTAPYDPNALPNSAPAEVGGAPSPPEALPSPLSPGGSPPPNPRIIDVEAREVEPADNLLSELEEITGGDGKKITVYRYPLIPWDQTPPVTGRVALSSKHTASLGSYEIPPNVQGRSDLEDFLYALFGAGNYLVQIRQNGRVKSQPVNLRLSPRPAMGDGASVAVVGARPPEIDQEARLLEARARIQQTMLQGLLETLNGFADFSKIQSSLRPSSPGNSPLPETREAALFALAADGDPALKARVIDALVNPPPPPSPAAGFLDRLGDFLFRFVEGNGEQLIKILGPMLAAAAAPSPPRRQAQAPPPSAPLAAQNPAPPAASSNLAPPTAPETNDEPQPMPETENQTQRLIGEILDLADANGRLHGGEKIDGVGEWSDELETGMANSTAVAIKNIYESGDADFQANVQLFASAPQKIVLLKLRAEYGAEIDEIGRLSEFVGKLQAELAKILN